MIDLNQRVVLRQEGSLYTAFFTRKSILIRLNQISAFWIQGLFAEKLTKDAIAQMLSERTGADRNTILEDGEGFMSELGDILSGAKAAPPVTDFTRPTSVELYIGEACNLSCSFCPQKIHKGVVVTEEAVRIVNVLGKLGIFFIKILGGETLLHPGIWNILDCAESHGMEITIITNGTLVDETCANRIASYENMTTIVSIDGVKMHDVVRGEAGLFEKSFGAVCRLRARDQRVGITYTMSKRNVHEWKELVMQGHGVGATVGLNPVKPYKGNMDEVLDAETYFGILVEAYRLKLQGISVDLMNPTLESVLKGVVTYEDLENECEASANFLSVMDNGTITPCSSYYYAGGHKGETLPKIDDLERAWNEDPAFTSFRRIYEPKGCLVRSKFYGQDPYFHVPFRKYLADRKIQLPLAA